MSGGDACETVLEKYTARDGADVTLTPSSMQVLVASGGQQLDELDMVKVAAVCRARRLDPFAGDCYVVKYDAGPATVIASKDHWLRVATSKDTFDGFQAGVVVVTRDGELVRREGCLVGGETERLVGGWARVVDKSRSMPYTSEVSLAEYSTGRSMWRTKPATMIRKVALVQALREAYPGELSGLYDASEIQTTEDIELPEGGFEVKEV